MASHGITSHRAPRLFLAQTYCCISASASHLLCMLWMIRHRPQGIRNWTVCGRAAPGGSVRPFNPSLFCWIALGLLPSRWVWKGVKGDGRREWLRICLARIGAVQLENVTAVVTEHRGCSSGTGDSRGWFTLGSHSVYDVFEIMDFATAFAMASAIAFD